MIKDPTGGSMRAFSDAQILDAVLSNTMPSVESVRQLENQLLQLPQVDLQTQHLVHAGVSARTVLIPAGTVLTGALTNLDNICVVCGDITVTTDEGPQRLTGFHVLPAKAGAKRAGVAHSDTWWTTLHHTDLTSVADIEDEMTGESHLLQTRQQAPDDAVEHSLNPPALSEKETQWRAEYVLWLEGQGMALEEAAMEGDRLIAIRRAFGHGPKETQG